ncbi:YhfG family protein [Photobacterium minamisatsumaniensis]|uniref:YhfG family protein n=1 Tax=Photobacterium minamisatsumaniensis TaxID=2910233 RepID=UPI003D0FFCCD
MLTEAQKKSRYKSMQARNYTASLQLEGIHLASNNDKTRSSEDTESKQIADLKLRYAR